jgi:nitroreductase
MKGTLSNMTQEQKVFWSQKQAYIGLGFALVAAATEGVDSTPMEGFNPQEVDTILGLGEHCLKSVLLLPLGYRDDENDYLSNQKKVRWDDSKFFIRK